MKNFLTKLGTAGLISAATLFGTLLTATPAQAVEIAESGGYAERPLTLPKGTLRIDGAPSDFAYSDFGELNDGRGLFRMGIDTHAGGQTSVYSGVGAAIGIIDDLEVGGLFVPIHIAPNADFGNIEAYARYRFLKKKFQMAVQGTIQIPTNNRFGMGVGLPMLYHINDDVRMDLGVEAEFMTSNNNWDMNIDLPLAFAFDITDNFFLGPRTGVRLPDMTDNEVDMVVPLGIFMGGTVADMVDITGHFNWYNFLNTYPGDTIDVGRFELMVGATLFLDVF